jgi:sulfite exporter TauE/SafE
VLPPGLWDINQAFCAADWLAIHYQKKVIFTLKLGHICALLTAIGYLTYTDLSSTRVLIALIIGVMLSAVAVNMLAVRGSWHRKYLDCRTLAEGLRVQFYWAAAGVTSGNVTKFAHDNFLQMQDTELGWIRNVMRVAGTECDVAPNYETFGLDFTIEEWIGNDTSGQLGYYKKKGNQRIAESHETQRIGRLGIWTTIGALTTLLFVGSGIPEQVQTPVVYLMGVVLLMVGVRQSYAKSTAESELIKQYEFMYRIFRNARRRIDGAESEADRRRILKVLGDSALEEHAEWILIHRERSIDEKEGLKLG